MRRNASTEWSGGLVVRRSFEDVDEEDDFRSMERQSSLSMVHYSLSTGKYLAQVFLLILGHSTQISRSKDVKMDIRC